MRYSPICCSFSSFSIVPKGPIIATQLNSTRRRVELRRYKRALTHKFNKLVWGPHIGLTGFTDGGFKISTNSWILDF